MLKENKILFSNIKNVRSLLTEGVGEDVIRKAIENHEWIYLHYNADNEEGKNASGYRTVRPYVLGSSKTGELLLRAWQDNPKNSWHFDNRKTRPDSNQHDYWTDSEGVKPGWRMFKLDKISKVFPIGKKFNDKNGLPLIPAGYHEGGDDGMANIIAYVSTKKQPDFNYKYDKDSQDDIKSRTERYKERWDSIRRGNKNSKQITADDVNKLAHIATKVQKTAKGKYLVVINDRQEFLLMLATDKDKQKIPDIAIVGNLPYLYDSLVNNAPNDERFFNTVRDKTKSDVENNLNQQQSEIKEGGLPNIPHNKSTFFK